VGSLPPAQEQQQSHLEPKPAPSEQLRAFPSSRSTLPRPLPAVPKVESSLSLPLGRLEVDLQAQRRRRGREAAGSSVSLDSSGRFCSFDLPFSFSSIWVFLQNTHSACTPRYPFLPLVCWRDVGRNRIGRVLSSFHFCFSLFSFSLGFHLRFLTIFSASPGLNLRLSALALLSIDTRFGICSSGRGRENGDQILVEILTS